MSLEYQILGEPGRDNALLATVDSGQSIHRLLFDCGERCLSDLPIAQIAEIEAVFFSHFHMDHIAGFDSFVRVNWNRADKPVRVFGPPGTIDIIHHHMRGYIWNLSDDSPSEWIVSEIGELAVSRLKWASISSNAGRIVSILTAIVAVMSDIITMNSLRLTPCSASSVGLEVCVVLISRTISLCGLSSVRPHI